MQACLTELTAARVCYRVVGRCHDIEYWPNADDKLPQLDHFRAYYPEELYPSEKVWLPAVLENIKRAYLTFPKPLEIYLPEEPLPEDAQVGHTNLHPSALSLIPPLSANVRRNPTFRLSSPSLSS